MRILKRIVEMVFIFLVPLMLLLFGLKINKVYDENNNLTSQYLTYENGIFREYNDNLEYKYTIENFNIWNEILYPGYVNSSYGGFIVSDNASRSDYILVNENTSYFLKNPSSTLVMYYAFYDSDKNYISFSNVTYSPGGIITTPSDCNYLVFWQFGLLEYKNNICLNLSVSWANGNYVPYGNSLIIYSNDNYTSGYIFKDFNYTWYNSALVSLSDHLQFNNNYMIQFIFIYVILIMLNLLLWYVFYVPFDMLFGLLLRKLEYYK